MTALGKLFRTTAFKLTLAYLVIFVIFAGGILGYVALNARNLIVEQLNSTIDAEINGLAEQYRSGNIRRLIFTVERRARQPGASLYLITTFAGERLAGNVGSVDPSVLAEPGNKVVDYQRGDDSVSPHKALVRVIVLPGGFRLLVGRDLDEQERFRDVIRRALAYSLGLVVVLACLGGWFITRRVLKRVDGMTDTTRTIMAGDLSGRLAIGGTGDELDRLALNLNAMLDRIGELMAGLKEVSDNIAHDLKTPLTRLRNRTEEALRTAKTPDDYRAALEATLEESDTLIRLFNALLMIARVEAGQSAEAFSRIDATEIIGDLAELYEPLIEEADGTLTVAAEPGLTIAASRELIGQALSNLLDNALKYGAAEGAAPVIAMSARRVDGQIELVVADRGPGIPPESQSKALERFARLEGARSRPGFGLGLNLVAAVARLHGGEFRMEDNAPGLKAVLRLPAG